MSSQPETESEIRKHKILVSCAITIILLGLTGLSGWIAYSYTTHRQPAKQVVAGLSDRSVPESPTPSVVEPPKIVHIPPPDVVRAIYITSWVASIPSWRERLIQLVEATELNAVIIDVKDYSGYITLETDDPMLKGNTQIRAQDLSEWIDSLHKRGIYVIARITVFQDPLYAKAHPSQAVQTKDGRVWQDRNGLAFVDASSRPFWEYIVRIAKASEAAGFDELNFDYIRFPTDGNLSNMSFPLSGPGVLAADRRYKPQTVVSPSGSVSVVTTPSMSARERVLDGFFAYLDKETESLGIPISADVFGLTTNNYDDLGIGQVLETVARHFDYVCPMVYPSHYPSSFGGYANPAAHPYEIISIAMKSGVARLEASGIPRKKLRPWIQDFDMGADYDAAKIHAQKKAISDAGLTSFLVWDPSNKYTSGGFSLGKNEITR